MPRVSVVMPAYNDEKYVAETIQSVLDQTYQDFELVVTDNGSTDGTAKIIKSFKDPRIKQLTLKQNRGHCGGMNNSIRAAQGEFLALLNSDDVYCPDKLEKQVKFLDKNPHISILFTYADIIDKDSNTFSGESAYNAIFDRPNKANRFEWLSNFFLNDNCLCHPSALIRKKCQQDVGFFDERFALLLDLDYWVRTCLRYDIYILPERLTKFRVHENQGSSGKPQTHSLHYLELSQVLKHYLSELVFDNLSEIFSPETPQQMYVEKNMAEIDTEIEPLIFSMLKDVKNIDKELKAFFVGMLAFWVSRPAHRAFGLDVLYQVYKNPNLVEKIENKYSYNFSNLIKLAKAQDIFGIVSSAGLNSQLHSANRGLENLHAELNQVKLELEKAKAQLNQTSKDSEKVPQQLSLSQVNYIAQAKQVIPENNNYNYAIQKAVSAYEEKDLPKVVQFLEESLENTPLLVTETILDWLDKLANCSSTNGSKIDIVDLMESEEWDKLMKSVLNY